MLDYDWILPDEQVPDFTLDLLRPEDITVHFFRALQLTPPPEVLQGQEPKTPQKPASSDFAASNGQPLLTREWMFEFTKEPFLKNINSLLF